MDKSHSISIYETVLPHKKRLLQRSGVSETSERAAAGWSSGTIVARYTRALSGELAVEEFQRSWN